MPSTGTPSCSTCGSHSGASLSYTELGPPDRTMPTGSSARTSSSFAVHGRIAENTCCSRMRRAISCVYCPPKSRTTIPCRVLTVPPACCCAAVALVHAIQSPPWLRPCFVRPHESQQYKPDTCEQHEHHRVHWPRRPIMLRLNLPILRREVEFSFRPPVEWLGFISDSSQTSQNHVAWDEDQSKQ